MIYGNLKDIIRHTSNLGFIDIAKLSGIDGQTVIESIAADKTVVMTGTLKNNIAELDGKVVGFSRMGVLAGMLKFPAFDGEGAVVEIISQERAGETIPSEVSFKSATGHSAKYRLMSKAGITEQCTLPPFKGAQWDVVIEPTKKNLADLAYFSGVLGSYEPVFTVVAKEGKLNFHIGAEGGDRSVVPVAENIEGTMKHQWSWPLAQVLSILKLGDESICTMYFSDQGALKITIDSGMGTYEYILPARAR